MHFDDLSAIVCKNRPKCNQLLLNLTTLTSNSESRPFFKYMTKKLEFEKIRYCPFLGAQRCSCLKEPEMQKFLSHFFNVFLYKTLSRRIYLDRSRVEKQEKREFWSISCSVNMLPRVKRKTQNP